MNILLTCSILLISAIILFFAGFFAGIESTARVLKAKIEREKSKKFYKNNLKK